MNWMGVSIPTTGVLWANAGAASVTAATTPATIRTTSPSPFIHCLYMRRSFGHQGMANQRDSSDRGLRQATGNCAHLRAGPVCCTRAAC